jgi:hypothetical protein
MIMKKDQKLKTIKEGKRPKKGSDRSYASERKDRRRRNKRKVTAHSNTNELAWPMLQQFDGQK